MNKLGRNYSLTVETPNGGSITIAPPLTVVFNIVRSTLSSVNVGSITVYNLSALNRNQIQFNKMDTSTYRKITFRAGYGKNIPIVFTGNITQAYSVRVGNVFETRIEAYDGGFAYVNGVVNFPPFAAGSSIEDILVAHVKCLPNISLGKISDSFIKNSDGSLKTISRDTAYHDNTVDSIKGITNQNAFFIDNGIAYILDTSDTINSPNTIISSSTGLLETPIREQNNLTFEMLFEPGLLVGQNVTIDSKTNTTYNGNIKVTSLSHRGMISDAVSGDAITTVGMLYTPGGTS